jgi:hypothetical protein
MEAQNVVVFFILMLVLILATALLIQAFNEKGISALDPLFGIDENTVKSKVSTAPMEPGIDIEKRFLTRIDTVNILITA